MLFKKIIITALVYSAAVTLSVGSAEAVDFSAGVSAWYTGWRYKDDTGTTKIDPAFMVGPMLSLGFNRTWSWSNVLMYGRFKFKTDEYTYDENTGEPVVKEKTSTYYRFDIDSTLNYNLNRYVKFFGGVKYSKHGVKSMVSHAAVGPAIGIGITVPLTPLSDYLFAVGTLSGIVMRGKEKSAGSATINSVDSGFNSTLSLAYYFDSTATTVILGGRYQYMKARYEDQSSSEAAMSDMSLKYYGIVVSAVHTFDFSSAGE